MQRKGSHQYVGWVLFAIIAGAYLLMAVKFPHAYIVATYEDLVGEWAQVFLFSITMLLAARQAYCCPRFRWFFSLLALACLYVAGEEISWGQRLFNIPTPEFFSDHNLQQETNLHNFFTGPISTLTKQAIEYGIAAGLVGYGLLYPWLLQRRQSAALWLEGKGLAAPPLYLWPFFVFSALLEIGLFHFNEAEIAEILIPFALAIMTLNYRLASKQPLVSAGEGWSRSCSRRLSVQTVLLFVGVISLAFGTTLACYESPRLGPGMADRYYSGVEKFAGRYKRFEQWETAALLYREIQQDQPNRASVRRNLYRCYEQLGQHQEAQRQLEKAIEIDLQRVASKPDSVAANISLVRNYQLIDDRQKMQQYSRQALAIGLANKTAAPQEPGTAYWLGRSYELQGNYTAAYQEFDRAVNLRPDSIKYKKALLAVSRLLSEQRQTDES